MDKNELSPHPSPLLDGCCRPVRHAQPALPMQLPPIEAAQESKIEDNDEVEEEYDEDTRGGWNINRNVMI